MTYRTQRIFIEALSQPRNTRAKLAYQLLESLARAEAVKTAGASHSRQITGLKPGANETRRRGKSAETKK